MFQNLRYDLTRIPYGRRGTYFYLALYEEEGTARLWACHLLYGTDTAGAGQTPRCGRLFPILLQRDGKDLPYRTEATPACVKLTYEGGSARLCLQEDSILRMEATGAEVVFSPALLPHEIAKDRGDGSWEVLMNPVPKLLLCPLSGAMTVKTGFDVITSQPEDTVFRFSPDDSGRVELAVHLYRSNAWRLPAYPSMDSVIAGIEAEFAAYLDTAPQLPAAYADARTLAAYIIWSHIMPADGTELIYMNKGIHRCTSSWQQSFHAMGQYRNPAFAWQLQLSVFRWQDDFGMLPDMLYDSTRSFGGTKPPFHGVAMEFLKEYTSFPAATRHEKCVLYNGLSQWVFWWLSYRDTDGDGIAQYDTADESGWDDSSFFHLGGPTEAPDLAAYLILAMDNLGDLAQELGKFYEAKEWHARAARMTEQMIDFFWDGEHFTPRVNSTHERVDCGSVMEFIPLLLGRRLPQEIIDRLADRLSQEGLWLSPYGLAGERMDSPRYHDTGWSAGPILAPAQLLVLLGLHFSGKDELAKEIAGRYCRALIAADFPMVMNPRTGADVSEGRWGPKYPNRMAWTAVVFLILGSLYL